MRNNQYAPVGFGKAVDRTVANKVYTLKDKVEFGAIEVICEFNASLCQNSVVWRARNSCELTCTIAVLSATSTLAGGGILSPMLKPIFEVSTQLHVPKCSWRSVSFA